MISMTKIIPYFFSLLVLSFVAVTQAEPRIDGFSHSLSPKLALEKEPYSHARFEALQAEGKVVLIDVYATWCA